MSIQDRAFSLAAKVVKIISLKNVLIWSFAAIVLIAGYTAFENRTALIDFIISGRASEVPQAATFSVSEPSRSRIKSLVDADDLINNIVVLTADIRNNRRLPIFWYADEESLQRQVDGLFSTREGGIPLFTSDEKNNENMVGIINGEFACGPFAENGNGSIFPGLDSRMPFVCRTSLPPYYGQFSGYITVSLNRIPTQSELDIVKTETVEISTEIYFRDVLPTSRKIAPSPI